MTIDERALDIAVDVYCKVSDEDGDIRNAVHEILTAYEAACWRSSVQGMPEDRSKIVIWYGNALYHGEDFAVVRNAMFRTIDPPTPYITYP